MAAAPPSDPRDGFRRWLAEASKPTRDAVSRLGSWVVEHQDEILRTLLAIQAFTQLRPEIHRLQSGVQRSGWSHVFDRLDFEAGVCLLVLLEQRPDSVDAFLETSLTEAAFLAQLEQALTEAPFIEPNRQQLLDGIAALRGHRYPSAAALMILGLEGAFWSVAEARGLVQREERTGRQYFTPSSGRSGEASSVDALFGPLSLEPGYASFLRRQVFGATGNPYRHGNAPEGWRRRALALTIALVGWLDLYGGTERELLLLQAFNRVGLSLPEIIGLIPDVPLSVLDPDVLHAALTPMSVQRRQAG